MEHGAQCVAHGGIECSIRNTLFLIKKQELQQELQGGIRR